MEKNGSYILDWTSDVLHNLIQFAKEVTPVSDNDMHIIMQSRKTLLYNVKTSCVKCYGNEDFEAFMGCYDQTEVWVSRILPTE